MPWCHLTTQIWRPIQQQLPPYFRQRTHVILWDSYYWTTPLCRTGVIWRRRSPITRCVWKKKSFHIVNSNEFGWWVPHNNGLPVLKQVSMFFFFASIDDDWFFLTDRHGVPPVSDFQTWKRQFKQSDSRAYLGMVWNMLHTLRGNISWHIQLDSSTG